MTHVSSLVVQQLARLGVLRPSPALLSATEAELAPHIAALIERRVTKTLVARAFASTLVEASPPGSPEGGTTSTLASSPMAAKPLDVSGAKGEAP
jgi:hypothetical protein